MVAVPFVPGKDSSGGDDGNEHDVAGDASAQQEESQEIADEILGESPKVPWATGDLPASEEEAINEALGYIETGTTPSNSVQAYHWGIKFKNWGNDLPGVSGPDSPYKEYRVMPQGQTTAGPLRLVINSDTGERCIIASLTTAMQDLRLLCVSDEWAVMQPQPGVIFLSAEALDETRRTLERERVPTYVMLTSGNHDKAAFFQAIKETFPLGLPLYSSRSWDALVDSLSEGLHNLRVDRVAILWPNSAAFRHESQKDFSIAISVLADVAERLRSTNVTVTSPTDLSVYLDDL